MTIEAIKERYKNCNPGGHYFDKDTLKFFGQTLKSFNVKKIAENKYHFWAKSYWQGKYMGMSEQIIDWNTGKLEDIPEEMKKGKVI